YLASPESNLAESPLPILDPLLEFRRPRKEWTFEELAPALGALEEGRSYGNGKRMFEVATCVSCHRIEDTGADFGPDLGKLDAKKTSADILRDLLEPSAVLNEEFRAWTFILKDGNVVNGLVTEEADGVVKVVENPLAKAEPTIVKASDIATREKAATSIMPEGLLATLTREEILDLIAYVVARGDRNHAVFRGGVHDHGEHGDHGEHEHAAKD
ncbi:MAG TPA: c-type cytochrome, partial [Planctomycetota bacterium]|nr:c-type cytochrome [Planctomycetota bacterium]